MRKRDQIIKGAYLFFFIMFIITRVAWGAEIKYKMFYTDDKGKTIEATQALISSMKGEVVYKCQSVEANVAKSGVSIGLRNVKKPKAE